LQEGAKTFNLLEICSLYWFFEPSSNALKTNVNGVLKEVPQVLLQLLAKNGAVAVLFFDPALDKWFPAHLFCSQVDHAASADRSWTSLL
jgi:hypothetical protein